MIGWLLWRDLTMMTRLHAVWNAVVVQIVALGFTVIMWGDGIPVLSGSPLEQFTFVWRTLLIALLPWIAARCSVTGVSQLSWIAALTASAPQAVLLARIAALSVMLLAAVLAASPLYVLAFRIDGGAALSNVASLAQVVVLCPFVASLVTATIAARSGRVLAWLVATMATAIVVLIPLPIVSIMAATAVLAAIGMARAERQLMSASAYDARD